jgi:DNA-binding LacI/PurR family transcriptional regulator
MALAGLAVAAEMGVPVPERLSIVAWDDSLLCRLVHPPLTAVGLDIPSYGAEVARRLLDLVAGRPVESGCHATPVLTPRGEHRDRSARRRLTPTGAGAVWGS